MSRIHVLTDRVANQIAAGEVIERPAAVIKELVENALDAGATRVEVEFSHGGRSFMRVEDNGCGMSRDDALLALERHATSKIVEADDLNRLQTFGFRGEALPSIASVSKFLLQTREKESDVGCEISINGGKFVHVHDCGRAVGTRIEVAQLFNSVPARRKFLKSDPTEAAHIIHGVRLYALSFPQVGFTLLEEGRVIFRSPQCTTLEERVVGIFGRQVAEGLISLGASESGMRVTGLIGLPGQGRATRHEMITFINQRPVDSRTLNYALIESFHESLPKGRYPVAFIFFEISPAEVDVNVHPAKREVRFRSEPAVRSFVIRTILSRLREISPTIPAVAARPEEVQPLAFGVSAAGRNVTLDSSSEAKVSLKISSGLSATTSLQNPAWPAPVVTVFPRADAVNTGDVSGPQIHEIDPTRPWRMVGLVHRFYAVFETPSGLVLIDRRSAEERVLYERLQSLFAQSEIRSQRLLLPVPLELDTIAAAMLFEALPFLVKHGFEIAEFGRNFFRIEAVPDWMEPNDAEAFTRDLVGLLREGRLHPREVDLARDELARFAATRCIRVSDSTNEAELKGLLAELFKCRTPLTNPSGRPTLIELSMGEITRRFGR